LEYCSHIWAGAAECHFKLLNKIQRKATRLVGDTNLTSYRARRGVASLSLFYRYFHGHCANSNAELMPQPAVLCGISKLGTHIECTSVVHALLAIRALSKCEHLFKASRGGFWGFYDSWEFWFRSLRSRQVSSLQKVFLWETAARKTLFFCTDRVKHPPPPPFSDLRNLDKTRLD